MGFVGEINEIHLGLSKNKSQGKGIGKILQNEQTEPVGVTRRRMCIRRGFQSFIIKKHKIKSTRQAECFLI